MLCVGRKGVKNCTPATYTELAAASFSIGCLWKCHTLGNGWVEAFFITSVLSLPVLNAWLYLYALLGVTPQKEGCLDQL